jgi:hypothetical protein
VHRGARPDELSVQPASIQLPIRRHARTPPIAHIPGASGQETARVRRAQPRTAIEPARVRAPTAERHPKASRSDRAAREEATTCT